MKNLSLAIILILILSSAQVITASADGPAPITGKFSPSVGPQITSIDVLDESFKPVLSVTPNTYYYIQVNVSDHQGIGDLKDIELKMWYDDSTSGSEVDEGDYFDHDSTYDVGSGYRRMQFKWDRGSNSVNRHYAYSSNWSIDTGSGLPTANDLENKDKTSHAFLFRVLFSRGANEAANGNVWQIAARVKNKTDQSAYVYYGGVKKGIEVNWYGEVVVKTGTKVEWTNAVAGMKFQDSNSHRNPSEDVAYFSNGLYDLRLKASSVWKRTTDNAEITLSSDASAPGTFALRAYIGPKPSSPLEAISLDSKGSFTRVKEGTNYGEENVVIPKSASYNNLYLQVNSDNLSGTYTGLIYYSIANR